MHVFSGLLGAYFFMKVVGGPKATFEELHSRMHFYIFICMANQICAKLTADAGGEVLYEIEGLVVTRSQGHKSKVFLSLLQAGISHAKNHTHANRPKNFSHNLPTYSPIPFFNLAVQVPASYEFAMS